MAKTLTAADVAVGDVIHVPRLADGHRKTPYAVLVTSIYPGSDPRWLGIVGTKLRADGTERAGWRKPKIACHPNLAQCKILRKGK